MSTQIKPKFRNAAMSAVVIIAMGALSSLLTGNAATAQQAQLASSGRQQKVTQTKAPTNMESYNFFYSYNNPMYNGSPATEAYLGNGFTRPGTYHNGQTIPVLDGFGRPVGSYTIGSVNDNVAYDANKINTVSVTEYDLNNQKYTLVNASKGAVIPNTSNGGLGNEHGSLTLGGSFNNQTPAFPANFPHS
jgi:hypothetical protein